MRPIRLFDERAEAAHGQRFDHQRVERGAAGGGDDQAGEDRREGAAAGRCDEQCDARGEGDDTASAERSVARHVGLCRRESGARQDEQEAECEHVYLLETMLPPVRARGNVIMHGRNGAP